jgi:hypothetical protein
VGALGAFGVVGAVRIEGNGWAVNGRAFIAIRSTGRVGNFFHPLAQSSPLILKPLIFRFKLTVQEGFKEVENEDVGVTINQNIDSLNVVFNPLGDDALTKVVGCHVGIVKQTFG